MKPLPASLVLDPKTTPNLFEQVQALAEEFGVAIPGAIFHQAGSPSERYKQQLSGIAVFLRDLHVELTR